jgi:hypothetical protein
VWKSGRGLRTYQRQNREAREHGRAYRLHTRESGIYGQTLEQETGLHRELVAPAVMIRISNKRRWYPYRGKPKGKRRMKAVLASSYYRLKAGKSGPLKAGDYGREMPEIRIVIQKH